MTRTRFERVWFVALVFALLIAGGVLVNAFGLINPWLFHAPLPVPVQALSPHIEYFSPSMEQSQYRELSFDIFQDRQSVRAFYRTELLKQGWTYLGVAQPNCANAQDLLAHTSDMYDNGGRTLFVQASQSQTPNIQQVVVAEHLYAGSEKYPIQQPPGAGADTHTLALGFWQAGNTSTEQPVMLCLYNQGSAQLLLPNNQLLTGSYQWAGDNLQMTIETTRNVQQLETAHAHAINVCRELFPLFSDECRSEINLISPMSYPGPNETHDATPVPASSIPAYLAPGQYLSEVTRMSGMFAITVNQTTLLVTNRLGSTTTFHRVL